MKSKLAGLLALLFLPALHQPCEGQSGPTEVPEWWLIEYFNDIEQYGSSDDPDGDGLTNLQEYKLGTNPATWDSDGDGLDDYWEAYYQTPPGWPSGVPAFQPLDPLVANNILDDIDGDGLSTWQEYCGVDGVARLSEASRTFLFNRGGIDHFLIVGKKSAVEDDLNPLSIDTDNDMLIDSFEAAWFDPENGIDPKNDSGNNPVTMSIARADTDQDGLSNYREQALIASFRQGGANENKWLWDKRIPFSYYDHTPPVGEGGTVKLKFMVNDGVGAKLDLGLDMSRTIPHQRPELRNHGWTKPSPGTGYPQVDEPDIAGHDTDGDMLPDGWEVEFGLDPRDPLGDNGPWGDPDGDGILNLEEYFGPDGNRSSTQPYINGTGDETNPNQHNWRPDSTYKWRWRGPDVPYTHLADPREGSQLSRIEILGSARPTASIGSSQGNDSDDNGIDDLTELVSNPPSNPTFSCDPFIPRSVLVTNSAGIRIPDPEPYAGDVFAPAGTRADLQRRNWTIECMVKLTATNMNGYLFNFITAFGGNSRLVYSLQLTNNAPVLRSSNVGGTLFEVRGKSLPTNQWIHLAGSWDHANNSLNLYIDGALAVRRQVNGECASFMMYPATNDLRLAASPDGSFVNQLYLDEIRIWGVARTEEAINEYSRKLVPQSANDDVWVSADGTPYFYRFKDAVLLNGGALFDGEPGVPLNNVYTHGGNYWIDNGDGMYRQNDDILIRHIWGTLNEGQAGAEVNNVLYNDKDSSGGFSPQGLLAYYRFNDGGATFEDFARKAKSSLMGVTRENYAFGDFGYALGRDAVRMVEGTNAAPVRGMTTYGADDSDGDGLPDAWEILHGLDPYDDGTVGESVAGARDGPNGAKGDPDGDGLWNIYEYWARTNPREKDTDGNGITDDQEDFDGDGLVNIVEQQLGTRPDLIDTDDDGLSDPEELALGTDPASAEDPPVSRCISLGGTPGDYMDIPHSLKYRISNWTLEGMVYPTNTTDRGTVIQRVVEQLDDGRNVKNYALGITTNAAGGLQAFAGYLRQDGSVHTLHAGSVPLNAWTHLAASYNPTTATMTIYVNGELVVSNTTFSASPPLNGLGGELFVRVGENFPGKLDEIRVWGAVRTDEQIAANWNKTIDPNTAGLVGYYRFDDGQANTNRFPFGPFHQPRGAQDYTVRRDWNTNWAHAAVFHGNVHFEDMQDPPITIPPTLKVTLTPPAAVNLGAAWAINNGNWINSGESVEAPAGSSELSFRTIPGWLAPAARTVILTNATFTEITAQYMQGGALTVNLEPAAARTAGARWRIAAGAWREGGQTVENITPGSHLVEYQAATGYIAPASEYITIADGESLTILRNYTPAYARLTVSIAPSAALASGARWRIGTNAWQSETLEVELSEGSYAIHFQETEGWIKPESLTVTLTNGQIRSVQGTYYRYRLIGGFGTSPGELNNPYGIAADGVGNLYISDTGNNRIQLLRTNGVWQVLGSAPELSSPLGIALDYAGGLLVVDAANFRLNRFNLSSGGWSPINGPFVDPVGVAVDVAGRIYVTDRSGGRVWRRNADEQWIELIANGTAPGRLQSPWGLAINLPDQHLFVSDHYFTSSSTVARVQCFTLEGSYVKTLVAQTNALGTPVPFPAGMALHGEQSLYAALPNPDSVESYRLPDSSISTPLGPSILNTPTDLAIAGSWLYVADSANNRIVALELPALSSNGGGGGGSGPGFIQSIILLLMP